MPTIDGRREQMFQKLTPQEIDLLRRFVRWRQAGIWDRIMDGLAAGHDAAVQMIDTSVVCVHGACIADNNHQDIGRSQGGLTSGSRAGGRQWLACATRPHRKSPKSGSGCLARRHRSRRT
jgi:hypothetical protein